MTQKPTQEIADVLACYPAPIRSKLRRIRALIFETAATTEGVGKLEETLKWGEPAYLTSETKAGSTIRFGWKKSKPDHYAIYFICHTQLVDTFREQFSDELTFDGNRAIIFHKDDNIPRAPLQMCLAAALTYHLNKSARKRA